MSSTLPGSKSVLKLCWLLRGLFAAVLVKTIQHTSKYLFSLRLSLLRGSLSSHWRAVLGSFLIYQPKNKLWKATFWISIRLLQMSALLATLESWWCLGRLAGFRGKLNAQPEPKEPTIRAKVRELCPAAEPGWKEPCNAKVCALWRPKHWGGGKGNFGKAPSSTWKTNTSSCTMWAVCSKAESSLKVLYMTSISAMEMTPLNTA